MKEGGGGWRGWNYHPTDSCSRGAGRGKERKKGKRENPRREQFTFQASLPHHSAQPHIQYIINPNIGKSKRKETHKVKQSFQSLKEGKTCTTESSKHNPPHPHIRYNYLYTHTHTRTHTH